VKFEFSAGGIVFRGAQDFGSEPQFSKKKIEILVCQHSQYHGWVFPKGLIGDHVKGEQKEDTALREVEEETGVKGKIIKLLEPVKYWYAFEGEKIKKTVYYFLMKYISGDITNHDMEMENVEWLPEEDVEKRLTYPSDKKVWQEAKRLIANGV
jgi:8-oxo-dGTP pyrophosphatase MutT (NUDIX family)